MLVTKVTSLLALAACAVAARSGKQTMSDIDNISNHVDHLNGALKNYNGGLVEALPVAYALRDTTKSVSDARAHVEGDEPFADEDAEATRKAWEQLEPSIVETARLGTEKAPQFKKAGAGSVASKMLGELDEERKGLTGDMQRMSESEYQNFQPHNERINGAFDDLMNTYNN
ncbi:cell wall mannoprotein 1 family protein [Aspergillus affinis]|uniref:cell wall mannoprotein 1 family protein n=1 Tax=Aspergillus affinis TaxID=1070780 RepID=UPI0022FF00F2|nr:uncharacterized protein KD926_007920 [Aspergillus affinis]KAI9045505.1 hypothetical protein KD926_007920 [Aspergillus affinis]